MKKQVALLLILTILVLAFSVTVFAEENGIMPASEFYRELYITLKMTEDGWAKMTAAYEGIDGAVDGAHLVFTLQKQGWLWFIWDDVVRWIDIELTGTAASRTISYPLESTGNYKLIVDFTFYNSAGETEERSIEVEASY